MAQITNRLLTWIAMPLAAGVAIYAQGSAATHVQQLGKTAEQTPVDAQSRVKVRVALVTTPVTVRNDQGEMVHDLEPQDFRITDNGAEQKITHLDLGNDPLSLLVLVETSSRIDSIFPELQKSGIVLTQTVMGHDGEAAVVTFNDEVEKLQDFTGNSDAIETTISHLQTGSSGLRLFDAMSIAVGMLSERGHPTGDNPGRRRVLLIMAEAQDIGSETKLGAVLRQAQLANVTIYSVGLSTTRAALQSKKLYTAPQAAPPGINTLPSMPGTIQSPETDRARTGSIDLLALAVWTVKNVENTIKDHPLEIATTATGGAHFATFRDRSIDRAIDEIGGELHSQYAVTYISTNANTQGYHEIRVILVQTHEKKLSVRTRPGYYVAPPQS